MRHSRRLIFIDSGSGYNDGTFCAAWTSGTLLPKVYIHYAEITLFVGFAEVA